MYHNDGEEIEGLPSSPPRLQRLHGLTFGVNHSHGKPYIQSADDFRFELELPALARTRHG